MRAAGASRRTAGGSDAAPGAGGCTAAQAARPPPHAPLGAGRTAAAATPRALACTAHMLLPAPRWQITRLHSLSGLPSMRAACGRGLVPGRWDGVRSRQGRACKGQGQAVQALGWQVGGQAGGRAGACGAPTAACGARASRRAAFKHHAPAGSGTCSWCRGSRSCSVQGGVASTGHGACGTARAGPRSVGCAAVQRRAAAVAIGMAMRACRWMQGVQR